MSDSKHVIPLRSNHHQAFLEVERETGGGWRVTGRIDGRIVGTKDCCNWRHVELYRDRMQHWLDVAEANDRARARAA